MKLNTRNFLLFLLLIGVVLVTGCTDQSSGQQSNSELISEADARQIALDKAGIDTATFTKQEYDASDADYEFEFHLDGKEYECEINAKTGTIKSYDVEEKMYLPSN